MSRGIKNGDLVLVKWVDSSSRSRWEMIEDAKTLTVMDCTTIGHLLNQDSPDVPRWERAVRVTQTTDPDGAVIHTIAIPKVCIQSITRLIEAE